jgi:hypothetical protein
MESARMTDTPYMHTPGEPTRTALTLPTARALGEILGEAAAQLDPIAFDRFQRQALESIGRDADGPALPFSDEDAKQLVRWMNGQLAWLEAPA